MKIGLPKLALAGLVGGLVMFVWGAVSHMLLPLGTMGIKPAPAAIVPDLSKHLAEPGLYMFPGMVSEKPSQQQLDEYNATYERGPRGLIVYDPVPGIKALSPAQLIAELLTNILAAFLASWILARIGESILQKACLAGLIGAIAWLSISASHGIWYRFPRAFIMAECIEQVVGWFLSGLVIALCVRVQHPAGTQPAT